MNNSSPSQRATVRRSTHYPFLESILGPPVPYQSPRHLHEELEIALNPGRFWHQFCRGTNYHVPPGALLITAPEEPHTATSPESGKAPYVGLRLHPDFLRTCLTEMTGRPASMSFSSALLVEESSFSRVLLSFHQAVWQEHHSRLEQDALLQELVIHLLRLSADSFLPPDPRREPLAVQVAKSYLQDHYQENISLHQVAQLVHMSPFYFSRVFHAEMGFPPHAYLTQIRIMRAKRLLTSGTPLADVAIQTGFHSQSHFGWHFKRLVGLTPGQYVRDCQKHE